MVEIESFAQQLTKKLE
jgi:26S proteasome regulatory subunit N6